MQQPPSLFGQITSGLYPAEFSRLVTQFPTTRPVRGLSEYDHFLALCFGQLTYRESLRDIVLCLRTHPSRLYHLGFRGNITRTNLAYASRHRPWQLFEGICKVLMRRAAKLYANHSGDPCLPEFICAVDSTVISLALNLFPWSRHGGHSKGSMKLHIALSLKGNVPAWANLTSCKIGDNRMIDQLPLVPGAWYIMDRGYMDFVRLYTLHRAKVFFVVRCKEPISTEVTESRPVDGLNGILADQTVRLKSNWSKNSYREPLRSIEVYDEEHQVLIRLLTNNFLLPTEVIAQFYKWRWQVELFFKWIKQHLRLNAFYGRSENAVRCQVWSAISAYLLVAIFKKRLGIKKTLNEILQIGSVGMFDQTPANIMFSDDSILQNRATEDDESQKCFSFND